MSTEAPAARTRTFRSTGRKPALTPDQKHRQAVVTAAAWKAFGSGAPMIGFLNSEHAGLGGRPLDLALNSDEGLAAVLRRLSSVDEER